MEEFNNLTCQACDSMTKCERVWKTILFLTHYYQTGTFLPIFLKLKNFKKRSDH